MEQSSDLLSMALPFADIFDELAAVLFVTTIVAVAAVRLRQPLIVAFIAVGILAGPSGLGWIRSVTHIHTLAEMGLALLLFIVGLKLDVSMLRSMGSVALATGAGQVLATAILGIPVALAVGMPLQTAIYVAVSLTFSSTIIVVKMLSDKGEANSLHGRLSLGILIVQDVVVILAMILISAFSGKDVNPATQTALVLVKGFGLLAGVWLLTSLALPRLMPTLAKTPELLVLSSIMWAFSLSTASGLLGFSREIGAFLAGVSLASTPYREAIGARLSSLRDFLLVFFFLELGSRLDIGLLRTQIVPAIPLSLFVLIGNPLIVMAITGALGYRKRTSLLTGITVGQVSEFSLILIALCAKLGLVGKDAEGVVTMSLLVTITISTYMISNAHCIYEKLSGYLNVFERRVPSREDAGSDATRLLDSVDTVIFGIGRYGSGIAAELEARGKRVLGVDFDPQAVVAWRQRGGDAVYGDATDQEFARALHLDHVRWVVSSLRDADQNANLLKGIRSTGFTGLAAVATPDLNGEEAVVNEDTDLLLDPYADAAVQAADLIMDKEEAIARRTMDRQIEALRDHYVICGYGRMGQQIVKDLTANGVECVVVEDNPEQLPKLRDGNVLRIEGPATDDETLRRAGIERAKGLIAVAASDEENVFIVLTARGLNRNLFIEARSILKENEDKLRHAGADMVTSPYILGGRRLAAAVIRPEVMDFLDLVVHSDGLETEMAKITVAGPSTCAGKTLRDLNLWEACEVTLLAVKRPGEDLHANPSPSMELREGDELIVMGTPAQIESARKMLSAPGEC
ncbi:MAG: cation:proton antiporter [Armatimonadetes bacterium]|nr:cation:proton antiporter [Armatimonadota bacterium]